MRWCNLYTLTLQLIDMYYSLNHHHQSYLHYTFSSTSHTYVHVGFTVIVSSIVSCVPSMFLSISGSWFVTFHHSVVFHQHLCQIYDVRQLHPWPTWELEEFIPTSKTGIHTNGRHLTPLTSEHLWRRGFSYSSYSLWGPVLSHSDLLLY